MNLHTFRDALNSRKASLANDLDDDEEEAEVGTMRGPVEGEEDDGAEKVTNLESNKQYNQSINRNIIKALIKCGNFNSLMMLARFSSPLI
jgi:hypothetical protein